MSPSTRILLVAATPLEIAPTLAALEQRLQQRGSGVFVGPNLEIRVLLAGVGLSATAWNLGLTLANYTPTWMLQAGIAGAIDRRLPLGEVVQIGSERFADLGVENADGSFSDLFQIGLETQNAFPFTGEKLVNHAAYETRFLPVVEGISVQKVHGEARSIAALTAKYPEAQVESMEGAAFFFAGLSKGIPFVEVRAISNYVEPRNRDNWKIELAVDRLNEVMIGMLGLD